MSALPNRIRGSALRAGTFRLTGPDGRWHVRYRIGPTTLTVIADARPAARLTFALRPGRPAALRCATRYGDTAGDVARAWDLQPTGRGFASLVDLFAPVLDALGLEEGGVPSRTATRGRIRALALLRALGREAVRRCDPRARALAMRFPPGPRFWTYQRIVNDPSGRVAQASVACPGLLLVAHGLSGGALRATGGARRVLDAIVAGRPLRAVLYEAAALALAPEVVAVWGQEGPAARLRALPPDAHARALHARRLLLRRAGPLVGSAIFLVPPPRFAPEDVPREPVANARWFETMRVAGTVLAELADPVERERLSAFVSANAALLEARARRAGWLCEDPLDVDRPGLASLPGRLLRYARATGRAVPTRGTNALRLLERVRAWERRNAPPSPAARLGTLLRRVPALDLGEVTGVRVLSDDAGALGGVETVTLPGPPAPDVHVVGVEARHLGTPEALAGEGARMGHCVATRLPEVLGGELWIYATQVAGAPLTVAVRRALDGTLRLDEARGPENRAATPRQLLLLTRWGDALNGVSR